MSALSDLKTGLTGVDADDVTLVNNALEEVRAGKLPLPSFAVAFAAQLYARLLAEIDALENPP